jgi:hypothetical protein
MSRVIDAIICRTARRAAIARAAQATVTFSRSI